jgi:hypothetical protein
MTWMLENPTVGETIDGWTTTESITDLREQSVEFYQKTFDFSQTVEGLPAGSYGFGVQAFQRPGRPGSCSGVAVAASLYAGAASQPVAHALSDAQTAHVGGSESEVDGKFIPNDMTAAALYFAKGLYTNTVETQLTADGKPLKVGIRSTTSAEAYWTIFRNFSLSFHGGLTGDVNRDGTVDGADVDVLAHYLTGLTPDVFASKAADLDGNDAVDIVDLTLLIKNL